MIKQEIIEKIKIAEEISKASEQFPEITYKVVLSLLLSWDIGAVKELRNQDVKKTTSSKKRKTKQGTNAKSSNKGLSQKMNSLISDGFFEEIKTSKEIIAKLKLLGYSMKATSLPSYLIPKVRTDELVREEIKTKNGKIYGYIQKNK